MATPQCCVSTRARCSVRLWEGFFTALRLLGLPESCSLTSVHTNDLTRRTGDTDTDVTCQVSSSSALHDQKHGQCLSGARSGCGRALGNEAQMDTKVLSLLPHATSQPVGRLRCPPTPLCTLVSPLPISACPCHLVGLSDHQRLPAMPLPYRPSHVQGPLAASSHTGVQSSA